MLKLTCQNILRFICALFVVSMTTGSLAESKSDSSQKWPLLLSIKNTSEFEPGSRIVALGDLHSDFRAFEAILIGMKIVNKDLEWIADKTTLVINGDILDKGNNSRAIIDTLMRLENEAKLAGGRVITILGNHEMFAMIGNINSSLKDDRERYSDLAIEGESIEATYRRVFSTSTVYAEWISNLPSAVIVGKTLFVHAGIEDWIDEVDLNELNATVQAWVKHFQGISEKPPTNTQWVVRQRGPLLTRKLAMGYIEKQKVDGWLHKIGVDRIVVGHTRTKKLLPDLEHKNYGAKVVMIDTGISRYYGGKLSALEIDKDGHVSAKTFPRPGNSKNKGKDWRKEKDSDRHKKAIERAVKKRQYRSQRNQKLGLCSEIILGPKLRGH